MSDAPPHPKSNEVLANEVLVWDRVVRISHALLIALFAIAMLTGESTGWARIHNWSGYGILALVALRIVWGFVGSRHARFADFVRSPRQVLDYARAWLSGRSERHLGHNPLGGAMIVALLVSLVVAGATGWLLTLPGWAKSHWLAEAHEIAANAVLGLVVLHVAGVIVTSFRNGENLISAMITGRKRAK